MKYVPVKLWILAHMTVVKGRVTSSSSSYQKKKKKNQRKAEISCGVVGFIGINTPEEKNV